VAFINYDEVKKVGGIAFEGKLALLALPVRHKCLEDREEDIRIGRHAAALAHFFWINPHQRVGWKGAETVVGLIRQYIAIGQK